MSKTYYAASGTAGAEWVIGFASKSDRDAYVASGVDDGRAWREAVPVKGLRFSCGIPSHVIRGNIDEAVNYRVGGRGGPGRGQGLKAADGATGLKRTNITIDPESAETLRAYGDGDLSLGIRRAAAHIKSHA